MKREHIQQIKKTHKTKWIHTKKVAFNRKL